MLSTSIAKPQEDERGYRLIELPNWLRALLISDPSVVSDDADDQEGDKDESDQDEDGSEDDDDDDGDDEDDDEADDDEDESGKKAACAICLGVGSLCDPPQLDGLAHFAEHMVFMGTAKYPDENEWSAFLSEHGGEDNGETNLETTTCYFDAPRSPAGEPRPVRGLLRCAALQLRLGRARSQGHRIRVPAG